MCHHQCQPRVAPMSLASSVQVPGYCCVEAGLTLY